MQQVNIALDQAEQKVLTLEYSTGLSALHFFQMDSSSQNQRGWLIGTQHNYIQNTANPKPDYQDSRCACNQITNVPITKLETSTSPLYLASMENDDTLTELRDAARDWQYGMLDAIEVVFTHRPSSIVVDDPIYVRAYHAGKPLASVDLKNVYQQKLPSSGTRTLRFQYPSNGQDLNAIGLTNEQAYSPLGTTDSQHYLFLRMIEGISSLSFIALQLPSFAFKNNDGTFAAKNGTSEATKFLCHWETIYDISIRYKIKLKGKRPMGVRAAADSARNKIVSNNPLLYQLYIYNDLINKNKNIPATLLEINLNAIIGNENLLPEVKELIIKYKEKENRNVIMNNEQKEECQEEKKEIRKIVNNILRDDSRSESSC